MVKQKLHPMSLVGYLMIILPWIMMGINHLTHGVVHKSSVFFTVGILLLLTYFFTHYFLQFNKKILKLSEKSKIYFLIVFLEWCTMAWVLFMAIRAYVGEITSTLMIVWIAILVGKGISWILYARSIRTIDRTIYWHTLILGLLLVTLVFVTLTSFYLGVVMIVYGRYWQKESNILNI